MHFASQRNWLNDPNGLVFHKGRYHLFFQYNPYGVGHGHMSWGHASSTDLVGWEEHPVALLANEREEIYSGSAVVDETDSAGFGGVPGPALVAVYTAHARNRRHQAQALAYSHDDGLTWTAYEGNPVLDRQSGDFRDPKVFRYRGAAGEYWVMVAVEAADHAVVFYRSDDLRSWEYLSSYAQRGAVGGVWECPDLFPLAVDGDPHDLRWVLLISLCPGGIAGGSGTQYVVGTFDGERFVPDEPMAPVFAADEEPGYDELLACSWLDFGRDCYAGVTFSGLPDEERTLIAWMSNWAYAPFLPVDAEAPQRGRMTLARRLSLSRRADGIRLVQTPIVPRTEVSARVAHRSIRPDAPLVASVAQQAVVRVRLRVTDGAAELRFGDGHDVAVVVRVDGRDVTVDRRAGAAAAAEEFGSIERVRVEAPGVLDAEIWLDTLSPLYGSLELFADAGAAVLTDLVIGAISQVEVAAVGGVVEVDEVVIEVVAA
ncbi:MAG: glycoside hydrolase family 32 protein [Microbacterium sp.]